jgi:tetratricopeptide (TPR) repeat protein/tRNA A-37 threonylcarbamoyl transferase component Bud32
MRGVFDAVRELVDRFSVLNPGACGGCQKEPKGGGNSESVFALHPLGDSDPEAVRRTQRGVRLLHEGHSQEALQEFHEARQILPQSKEACSNLGCAYHMSGDENSALYWYRQAHCFAPRDETAVLALSLLEQRRGQVMDAQKLLVTFLQEVDSSNVNALKQLGRLHQQQGHWSQAGGCFHRLISIEPQNHEWPAQLQMCLDQVPLKDDRGHIIQDNGLGAFARAFSFAEPILRQAVPMDSREGHASRRSGDNGCSNRQAALQAANASAPKSFQAPESQRSLAQTHTTSRTAHHASSFGSIQEDSPNSRVGEREPLSRENRDPSPPRREDQVGPWSVAQSFRMGADGEEDRFASQARVLDKRVVNSVLSAVDQLNRGSLQCREGIVIAYSASSRAYFMLYRQDAKDDAHAKFKRIMEQAPPGVGEQLEEASRLRGSGRSDAALTVYRNVIALEPRNSDAAIGIADCQCDLGDIDAALEAMKKVLGAKPDDGEANLRLAELLFVANQNVDLVEQYAKRANADSRMSKPALQQRVLCIAAEVALARDDLAKALTSAAEAVRIDSSARALILLGTSRLRVAEYQAALRALNAALDACTGSPSLEARRLRSTVHMLTAQAQERLRQYPQALAQAQAALELRPKFGDARVVKAMALQQSGRLSEAESELQLVLQHEPQHANARLQLGYMQLSKGDSQAACSLEAIMGSSTASRSVLGAAKIYLAMALSSNQQQHAEQVLKEGIALHRNLQHVWGDIESSPVQPAVAVQKLRGICDLDLTSQQAKQLLALLAQVHGRSDIIQGLSNAGLSANQHQARAPSLPPNRWAPTSPTDVVGAAQALPVRANSPMTRNGRSVSPGQWAPSNMQRAGSMVVRGRSVSPGHFASSNYYAPGPSRQRAGSADSEGGPCDAGGRGRQLPPAGGANPAVTAAEKPASTSITLGWDEVIRPEQLSYGNSLGSGGSASVFHGSWNGAEVAIKKISGLSHLEEMKKEINALRRLRHPRLVRFIGACIQPPQLLVVTEFMAGGSLYDRLFGKMKDPPLNQSQRWQVCLHMAEGLAFLHSQRVVHRDLKSMNILLDALQNAKICDFGLAQQMEATHIARKTDGEGGSPRYMAPECYEASYGKLTEKVDIWAMGCIFIELFGNRLPYHDCQSMAQLSARILVERKPPEMPATVEAPVREVANRCLEFDLRRRINAGELHAELHRVSRQLRIALV